MITSKSVRKIVKIDQDRCNGCGLCVPKCAEGAIRIEGGKARLVAENLCDGLGACLGHCPQDAITVEERPADQFDEIAVEQLRHVQPPATPTRLPVAITPVPDPHAGHSGCPGARMRMMDLSRAPSRPAPTPGSDTPRQSRLTHWPVQLTLVPISGPIWQDADVLICADCVPFAYPDFHEKLLTGPEGKPRSIAIACPKLDDVGPYVEKLAAIFAGNAIRSITVAHMEVPCCGGIVRAVHAALQQSGRVGHPRPRRDRRHRRHAAVSKPGARG